MDKKTAREYGYGPKSGQGAGEGISLYEPDELEVLREELLEAYSTPREKLLTRDEVAAIKLKEYSVKEHQKRGERTKEDESAILKIKAKQEALKRFYETVITEKGDVRQKRKTKKQSSSSSSASFHKLYTIFHDPASGQKSKFVDGKEKLEEEDEAGNKSDKTSGNVKVLDAAKIPPPPAPSKVEETDKQVEQTGKERSKFVMKQRLSKPPPLLEEIKTRPRTSFDMRTRNDTRYSFGKERFSFDVDVAGPFLMGPRKKAKVRTVAIQASMMDNIRLSGEMGSQTEFEVIGTSDRRSSKNRSVDDDLLEFGDEYDYDEEEQAGGDASSSNPSEVDEGAEEEEEEEPKGKILERKESRRREAETSARPRGYRDLDLREQLPYVSFEAETHVTAHDLDREEAKKRGYNLARDNILWPTCSEFDMDKAVKKIEDYIKRCWPIDPKWLFVIQPLEVYHDDYRKKYVFEVKFSVPSATTPVPPATASVFFVFEIPIYSMQDDTVKISYVLEGTRFAHSPGKIPFQDKWLWNIITDKLRVQKALANTKM